jgi:peptidoglycan/xylan/chitin deacetylase (PgdA/CDA1 family)
MRALCLVLFALLLACPGAVAEQAAGRDAGARGANGREAGLRDISVRDISVPILVYHRFGATVADAMTVQTGVFAAQLEYMRAHGYVVIPLRELVAYLQGRAPAPPEHAVVITADDGHGSVFTEMFPLIKQYRIPVTLFIYPSAISNASYAMSWDQLRQMRDSGLVDIQSHTYWHPNFRVEKRRLSARDYEGFVQMQLAKSKAVLERELGGRVDMLAWPFGIYDGDLMRRAREAGYVAAFTLKRRHASRGDELMALPRYLMTNDVQGRQLAGMLAGPLPAPARAGGSESPGRAGHAQE